MKNLTAIELKEKILEISKNEDYKFIGSKPCIIDFYAEWCAPCKITQVVLQQLEIKYSEIDFFKVDAENEYELVEMFGVKSLPTLIMINMKGEVKIYNGFLPKPKIEHLIETLKLKKIESV